MTQQHLETAIEYHANINQTVSCEKVQIRFVNLSISVHECPAYMIFVSERTHSHQRMEYYRPCNKV